MKQLLFAVSLLVASLVTSAALADTKVATPRAFQVTSDGDLGTRENNMGIAVGTQVADVNVVGLTGETVALKDLWQAQPIMVVFYRGGWCPFCNAQIRELTEHASQFEAAGVLPVLISVDAPDQSSLVQANYEVPFPVLSDSSLAAHTAFNVLSEQSAERVAGMKARGLDLSEWSGQDHGTYALASAFIIGTDGVVDWGARPVGLSRTTQFRTVVGCDFAITGPFFASEERLSLWLD